MARVSLVALTAGVNHNDSRYTPHRYSRYTTVYMAVYRPCTRPVYTAREHDCIRAVCTAVFGRVHGVYMAVYTRRVHGRVSVLYTAVNRPCTRPRTGRVGPCTRPCACRVHDGRCTWSCTRPVSTNIYTAVYGPCVLPCTRPCTGHVHGHSPCMRSVRSVLPRFSLQNTPFMPKRTAINPLHSKSARTTGAPSAAFRTTTVLRSMLIIAWMESWATCFFLLTMVPHRLKTFTEDSPALVAFYDQWWTVKYREKHANTAKNRFELILHRTAFLKNYYVCTSRMSPSCIPPSIEQVS